MYYQRGVLETIVRELTVLLGKREKKKKKDRQFRAMIIRQGSGAKLPCLNSDSPT